MSYSQYGVRGNYLRGVNNLIGEYEFITNQKWGNRENYDLCLNCEIGTKTAVHIICDYIEKVNNNTIKE